ncbi:MAG: hypothetical protein V3V15_01725 [Sphingorhabdus sp.]
MKTLSTISAALVISAAFGGPAQACRLYSTPETVVADRYENNRYTSIILAQVIEAGYTEKARNDWHPWAAKAMPLTDLSDVPIAVDTPTREVDKTRIYSFGRTGSTSACDDGVPSPSKDDIWILYMSGDKVINAYPLEMAYRIDTRLRSEWMIGKKDGSSPAKSGKAPDRVTEPP